ncbi:hypothetical protein CLAFUW4_03085 [Fulvia fulva]|uniref:Uncharacterized protein n=1 Tax=Passalora fulva TaxID=5499 RepID=A0A9Q8LBY3_PASFU|nr:uncharacterized protein CLAFUR5_03069 [Fulvia fulva]KAK4630960.1 hypothetical protein CLAFUR4_03078 [Fulvia fulva]KAK4633247.1 hypothetical protein CLAFUR0_03081 [Fulvia fulva]UJO13943.1 hypothetical protein CLAFUR5_03069 [Fulvia fulva]WPV11048.1 hypothetical protein CLAFUW4_03085 [Fulvia fulva]WPV25737.1 hypothetical protein CLAFUW7_03082 [Fulvia fulva]
MASLMSITNRLLPFATPGTPLLQDVIHLAVICTLLYFAPQIQECIQKKRKLQEQTGETEADAIDDTAVQGEQPQEHDAQEHGQEEQEIFEQEADNNENDGPDNDDFRQFQQQQDANEAALPGPADGPAEIPARRDVGAKKAKSLARKDQKRAYHEFQRAQGEAQRARDAEGAAEREKAQAAERERRKAAEAKLEAKKAKEREAKKEQERKEREKEIERRETAIGMVRRDLEETRMSNLFDVARVVGGDADEVWVEKILNAAGLLGKSSGGALTMVTSTGWVVKVSKEDMASVYKRAVNEGLGGRDGKISYDEFGGLLETVLKEGSSATA